MLRQELRNVRYGSGGDERQGPLRSEFKPLKTFEVQQRKSPTDSERSIDYAVSRLPTDNTLSLSAMNDEVRYPITDRPNHRSEHS